MKRKKIIQKQTYKVEVTKYSDGTSKMNRTCDGFMAWELLGIFDFCRDEIKDQIKGIIKPDIVKRKVIIR